MVHRLALLVGGLGALGVIAIALGFGGLVGPSDAVAATNVAGGQSVEQPTEAPVATDAPTVVKTVYDTVYVAPTPDPEVVHVNRPPSDTPAADNRQDDNQGPSHVDSDDDGDEHEDADEHEDDGAEHHERERGDDHSEHGGDD